MTDARAKHMTRTASAEFVLCSSTHTLFYINSRCKQACQFSDDHSIQILTAQEDDSGNYHSRGTFHTGPTINPRGESRGVDSRPGMESTEGVIISTIIRL